MALVTTSIGIHEHATQRDLPQSVEERAVEVVTQVITPRPGDTGALEPVDERVRWQQVSFTGWKSSSFPATAGRVLHEVVVALDASDFEGQSEEIVCVAAGTTQHGILLQPVLFNLSHETRCRGINVKSLRSSAATQT